MPARRERDTLLLLVITGFVERLTVERRRGVVTHGVGLFVPWRIRSWPLSAPARSGGEVALITIGSDGSVQTRLLWERFDGAVWDALCDHREALARVFPEGLEIQQQPDA